MKRQRDSLQFRPDVKLFVMMTAMLAEACTTTYHVQRDGANDAYSYSQLNELTSDKLVAVTLKSGSSELATNFLIIKDSCSYKPLLSGGSPKIASSDIIKVDIIDHSISAAEGTSFGIAAGAGAVLVLALAQPTPAEALPLLTPLGAMAGGIIGLVSGAIAGQKDGYIFLSSMPSDRQGDLTARNESPQLNIMYLDFTSLLLVGHVSLNYERVLTKNFNLRLGYASAGFFPIFDGGFRGVHGPLVMINYVTENFPSKFEAGLGGGFSFITSYDRWDNIATRSYSFLPAIAIGYRYQSRSGIFLRAGVEWVHLYGFPVHVSTGIAF